MVLFLIIVLLITYGSFYPFDFVRLADHSDAVLNLFNTWGAYSHQGDILANLILFVPFGITGIQMLAAKLSQLQAVFIILILGICLGIALQAGQIYLPSRDANLSDAVLNAIGTMIGIGIAVGGNPTNASILDIKSKVNFFPVLLLYSWAAYRLMPFVPSIDLQELKNGIKPIFMFSTWELVRVIHDATAWLVVFYILSRTKQTYLTIRCFSLGILLCFILEIIIVSNTVSLSNIVGAVLALVSWWALFSNIKKKAVWLTLLMTTVIVASGFSPYKLSSTTNSFQLLPFYGFLGGSMLVNTASLLEKFFLYGSLIWLFQEAGVKRGIAILISVTVTLFIEVWQVFLVGRVAEITDPLLVILIGFLLPVIINDKDQYKKTRY